MSRSEPTSTESAASEALKAGCALIAGRRYREAAERFAQAANLSAQSLPGRVAAFWDLQRLCLELDVLNGQLEALQAARSATITLADDAWTALQRAVATWLPTPLAAGSAPECAMLVSCLGTFDVSVGDRRLPPCPSRKAESVFRYLIDHRRHPVPWDQLSEAVWPDDDPRRARGKLKTAIYTLRRWLGTPATGRQEGWLLFSGGAYRLNPSLEVRLDAEAFLAYCRAAELAKAAGDQQRAIDELELAVALYHGDYMPDEQDQDWVATPREHLRDCFGRALAEVAHWYLDRTEWDRALRHGYALVQHDPQSELGYQVLMEAHARLGQREQAMHWYERCRAALAKELGFAPSAQMLRLRERIAAGAVPFTSV